MAISPQSFIRIDQVLARSCLKIAVMSLCLSAILLFSIAGVTLAESVLRKNCIPDKANFYWKSPCDGQTFANAITLSNLTATQNGQEIDVQGGLDMSIPMKMFASILDSYGEINKPLIDIGVLEYTKPLIGKDCQWKALPTFGLLNNIDSCTIVDNCKLAGHPTTLTASVNFKDLAGSLEAAIKPGNYYAFTMTFKDTDKPLLCVWTQSKVIKK